MTAILTKTLGEKVPEADGDLVAVAGTDTAKMAADMVMLDKDLAIICKGVLTGRITYGNTIK